MVPHIANTYTFSPKLITIVNLPHPNHECHLIYIVDVAILASLFFVIYLLSIFRPLIFHHHLYKLRAVNDLDDLI